MPSCIFWGALHFGVRRRRVGGDLKELERVIGGQLSAFNSQPSVLSCNPRRTKARHLHPKDEDLSLGTAVNHPKDEDLSLGTPDLGRPASYFPGPKIGTAGTPAFGLAHPSSRKTLDGWGARQSK